MEHQFRLYPEALQVKNVFTYHNIIGLFCKYNYEMY